MAKRLQAMGQANYVNGFTNVLCTNAIEKPLEWKKPQVIFVNSMSDLFHKDVPFEFIEMVLLRHEACTLASISIAHKTL